MAKIDIICSNFNNNYQKINGTHCPDVSRVAVFLATLTVGFQSFKYWIQVGCRIKTFVYRFGAGMSAFSFLEQSSSHMILSNEFGDLDPSEKAVLSYWYGMIFAKIVAYEILGISWLGHVDMMQKAGIVAISTNSKRRGDLVGLDSYGNWHVIEAKGRSNKKAEKGLEDSAKKQANSVVSINAIQPSTSSACITLLDNNPIKVLLDDPPVDNDGERWNINEGDFLWQYYSGIIGYISLFSSPGSVQKKESGGVTFVTAPLPTWFSEDTFGVQPFKESPLEIGLLEDIYKEPEKARLIMQNLPKDAENVGPDGIAIFGVVAGWGEE